MNPAQTCKPSRIIKKSFLFILIFNFNFIFAQEKNLSPFINIGKASDNDAVGNFGGGGGGFDVWEAGLIFKLGADYKLNESFFARGYVSYSFYKYDGSRSYGLKTITGYNNIWDVMTAINWKIGIFFMNLGVGISHQFNDDIRYLEETQFFTSRVLIEAKNKTVFAGQFGLGFDIHIYKRFSLLAEGDLFFREYLGSAWLLGMKYTLVKI